MSLPRLQLAFLTGRSNRASCALSPAQGAFLAQLAAPGRTLRPHNFPYAAGTAPFAPTGLARASWANLRDYLASRRAAFADRYRAAVATLLAQAQHTVLLAGSCGLELLVNLQLDPPALRTVSVFAYGAVARRRPACRCLLVQGRGDWMSRLASPRADGRVDGGHLAYLRDPAVLALGRDFVAAVERDLA